MRVLSLFDGMSCGQIALRQLGIKVDTYYASEVDKFAIAQTMLNFPDTIQLGDVRNINARTLGRIDLLMGGSPCQSFSFAGKRAGMSTKQSEEIYTLERYLELKQAGFEFEGQSYLFWEYVRILQELRESNPDVYFLLENVEMGKKWEKVLSEAIGLQGVHINSALVSAQIRKRIYWTNIRTARTLLGDCYTDIPQPEDRGILLRDILEDDADVDEKYYLSDEVVQKLIEHKRRNAEAGNGFGTAGKSHIQITFRIRRIHLQNSHCLLKIFLEIPQFDSLAGFLLQCISDKGTQCHTWNLKRILERKKNTVFCPLIDWFRRNILAFKPDFAGLYGITRIAHQCITKRRLTCTVRSHQNMCLPFTNGQIHAMKDFFIFNINI